MHMECELYITSGHQSTKTRVPVCVRTSAPNSYYRSPLAAASRASLIHTITAGTKHSNGAVMCRPSAHTGGMRRNSAPTSGALYAGQTELSITLPHLILH